MSYVFRNQTGFKVPSGRHGKKYCTDSDGGDGMEPDILEHRRNPIPLSYSCTHN